jgi:hypothetical protein
MRCPSRATTWTRTVAGPASQPKRMRKTRDARQRRTLVSIPEEDCILAEGEPRPSRLPASKGGGGDAGWFGAVAHKSAANGGCCCYLNRNQCSDREQQPGGCGRGVSGGGCSRGRWPAAGCCWLVSGVLDPSAVDQIIGNRGISMGMWPVSKAPKRTFNFPGPLSLRYSVGTPYEANLCAIQR